MYLTKPRVLARFEDFFSRKAATTARGKQFHLFLCKLCVFARYFLQIESLPNCAVNCTSDSISVH